MELIPVTNGVFWLDISEIGLFILCGSPADVMKHLKQKGFIIPKQNKGIYYETGPNAILLSDVSIQKGQFSNLVEFPLLHMLYLQGMGIPNHVNNRGQKPLLIGSESQIKAQLDSIYRGRYGLGSYEEILATGVSEEWAKELFRIKKHYAFNNIEDSKDFMDTCVLSNRGKQLKKGVIIERESINVFKVTHGDEELIIDLNLKANQNYEPAVDLDFHRINKDYFSIVHVGEGDGWDINKPCMGSLVVFQGKIYLIDAGPFILNNLKCLGISINEVEGIFHTHLHDDHFAGLTSLMYTDHRIKYYSSRLVRESVMKKLSAILDVPTSNCEKAFEIHDLALDKWNNINGLMVFPCYSPHPVETNVFLFRTPWEGGFKQYMHLGDISSREYLRKMLIESDHRNPI
ncbi:MAG: MBL fold metallo-hydrolase [Spirochaetaceae bacterium]|jgi:hemerythrin|nr:MBL fold metallo-hydrolase [Spirochaetaceae bacterium]